MLGNFIFRATRENVCICIAMSRKNSLFIREYYKHIILNLPGANSPLLQLFTRFLGEFVKDTLVSASSACNLIVATIVSIACKTNLSSRTRGFLINRNSKISIIRGFKETGLHLMLKTSHTAWFNMTFFKDHLKMGENFFWAFRNNPKSGRRLQIFINN